MSLRASEAGIHLRCKLGRKLGGRGSVWIRRSWILRSVLATFLLGLRFFPPSVSVHVDLKVSEFGALCREIMQKTDRRRSFPPCRCGIGRLDSGARIFSCRRCLCSISDKEEDEEAPYVHSSIGRSQFPLPPCAWNRVLFIIDHAVSAKACSPIIVFLFVPCLEYMERPFPSEPYDFCALLQPLSEIHVTDPKAVITHLWRCLWSWDRLIHTFTLNLFATSSILGAKTLIHGEP